ncbi:uncharacterized protein LOC125740749 isoform X2 [Brienomyrus brachyistius]|uniref:uncharacterized protein LOC125740749 isoform X2 n=1 Tax=Brienomyrus brachyistius TaxID=42636 RepID=UPI0020B19AFC|nr:uncharacterized protein LOC125740749 isoform X2 [Brienomyrus brachyistius]
MAQRMKIPKAVSWINDQHWGAWDLWDEVIDWGERKDPTHLQPAVPGKSHLPIILGAAAILRISYITDHLINTGPVDDWRKGETLKHTGHFGSISS